MHYIYIYRERERQRGGGVEGVSEACEFSIYSVLCEMMMLARGIQLRGEWRWFACIYIYIIYIYIYIYIYKLMECTPIIPSVCKQDSKASLHLAARGGHVLVADLLIGNGANFNAGDRVIL